MDLLAVMGMQAAVQLTDWEAEGRAALAAAQQRQVIEGPAKNVILFIADGMDVTTSSAARILEGQLEGGTGEENFLTFETLPWTGFSKTYNTNLQVPDSAGTATAMMTGHKSKAGMINIAQTVARGDCTASLDAGLPSILEVAQATGRASGIISTARITHATPATVYAHAADRDWETDGDIPAGAPCTDIASQLIETAKTYDLLVALGGGRRNFLPDGTPDPEDTERNGGARKDGRNLVEEWQGISGRHRVAYTATALAEFGKRDRVLGLFEPSHMMYEHDRVTEEANEPSLAEMTRFAIERLKKDRDGFFLMVEAGRVDHAHHGGNAFRALTDTIAFDEAIETALAMTNTEETLIIVTADHGHTMTFAGYPQRGNPIMGVVRSVGADGAPLDLPTQAGDQKPYTTLGYANGPGGRHNHASDTDRPAGRPFVSDEEALTADYKQQATVPLFSETHGGQDVAIYASGPGAHHLVGVHEQNYIYYVMENALRRD